MKRFNGGEKVPGGYYWNIGKWDIATISESEGVLEGPREERFLKLPLLVMVVGAALVSFSFVIFLPFVGFALVAYAVARKVAGVGMRTMREAAVTVAPGWQPGAAHLTGKSDGTNEIDRAEGAALDELKKEIDARRAAEDAEQAKKE